jgi:hypothetical protein
MAFDESATDNSVIAHLKFVSLQLLRGLRDNGLALNAQTFGAPYNQAVWHPYDGVTVGDGNDGLIFDHAVDGDTAAFVSPDWEDGYKYRFRLVGVGHAVSGSENLEVEPYFETDGVFDDARNIVLGLSNSQDANGFVEFLSPRSTLPVHHATKLFNVESDLAALNFDRSTSQRLLRARFAFSGVRDIQRGKIYMDRKRDLTAV